MAAGIDRRKIAISLVLTSLLAAGCAGLSSAGSTADPDTGADTGGRVIFDSDGDGTVSDGDEPVANAAISRLVVDPAAGLRILPGTPQTTTNEEGRFVLPLGQVIPSGDPGAQVGLSIPLANGRGEGSWHVRSQLDLGSTANVILLNQLPQACPAWDQSDVVPETCPTLALPDLVPIIDREQFDTALRTAADKSAGLLPPDTWFVDTQPDGQRLLRFASLSANLGLGVLDVIAEPGDQGRQQAWQRLWGTDLHYWDRPSGEFIFHPGHEHMHFDAFERYRLLDADGQIVASSDKVSFCLRDSIRVQVGERPSGVFIEAGDTCGVRQQAINPGFGDHYDQFLPDQWIDITGVPAGDYIVEITVDPENLILEADEENNVGRFPVSIPD